MILPKPTCEKHVHKHHNFFTPQSPYKDTMVSLSRHHGLFVKTPWSLCQDTMVSLPGHHGLFVRTPRSLCQDTAVSFQNGAFVLETHAISYPNSCLEKTLCSLEILFSTLWYSVQYNHADRFIKRQQIQKQKPPAFVRTAFAFQIKDCFVTSL